MTTRDDTTRQARHFVTQQVEFGLYWAYWARNEWPSLAYPIQYNQYMARIILYSTSKQNTHGQNITSFPAAKPDVCVLDVDLLHCVKNANLDEVTWLVQKGRDINYRERQKVYFIQQSLKIL